MSSVRWCLPSVLAPRNVSLWNQRQHTQATRSLSSANTLLGATQFCKPLRASSFPRLCCTNSKSCCKSKPKAMLKNMVSPGSQCHCHVPYHLPVFWWGCCLLASTCHPTKSKGKAARPRGAQGHTSTGPLCVAHGSFPTPNQGRALPPRTEQESLPEPAWADHWEQILAGAASAPARPPSGR